MRRGKKREVPEGVPDFLKPVFLLARELEEFVEEAPVAENPITAELVEEILDFAEELAQKTSDIVESVMQLAATVSERPKGSEALSVLREIQTTVQQLQEIATFLAEIAGGSENKSNAVEGLVEPYVTRYNEIMQMLRKKVSEDLFQALHDISREAAKEEIYFGEEG